MCLKVHKDHNGHCENWQQTRAITDNESGAETQQIWQIFTSSSVITPHL